MPSVLIPMADYGHDPTEVAIPFSIFTSAGFTTTFATETGLPPKCDAMMLSGTTGMLLGADAAGKAAYASLEKEECFQKPVAWSDSSFSMDEYDLVFLPGGHEKNVRQLIDSETIHRELARFFAGTERASGGRKVVAAICHGVQVLAFTPSASSPLQKMPITSEGLLEQGSKEYKSVIHECRTTALTGALESGIFQATRLFLGDYYKTYGTGTPNVEDYVKVGLDDASQFEAGPAWYSPSLMKPFMVEDEKYRYLTGRFPPDAEILSKRVVELFNEVTAS